nr:hypothetical protein [Pantoea vagans]
MALRICDFHLIFPGSGPVQAIKIVFIGRAGLFSARKKGNISGNAGKEEK